MTTWDKVKLNLPACLAKSGFVLEVNGAPIRHVRSLRIECGYDRVTEVTMTFIAEVEGDVAAVMGA
jgi:hypothetical protein